MCMYKTTNEIHLKWLLGFIHGQLMYVKVHKQLGNLNLGKFTFLSAFISCFDLCLKVGPMIFHPSILTCLLLCSF